MTAKEAAAALNCSVRTLSNYVAKGELTSSKKGRNTIYDPVEIATLSKTITKEKQKNGKSPQVLKNNKPFAYDIAEVGTSYMDTCRLQMQELDTYQTAFEVILYDLGLNYQLYRDYLDLSRESGDMEAAKLANMYYKNVEGMQKSLGLTPQAMKQLGVTRGKPKEPDMFDKLNELLK